MTGERARCAFCFAQSSVFPALTREHLMSRPVADAFGIDRTAALARVDSGQVDSIRWTTVNGLGRRFVCAPCNNGWMNALEHEMAAVSPWASSSHEPLGEHRAQVVRNWAFKTHLILCYVEGNASKFADPDVDDAVVPPLSLARAIYENRYDDLVELGVGLAINGASTDFAYEFGTPGVMTVAGVERKNGITAPASIISIGRLQMWVVTPLPIGFNLFVADGVKACEASVTMDELPALDAVGNLRHIRVDYEDEWPLP